MGGARTQRRRRTLSRRGKATVMAMALAGSVLVAATTSAAAQSSAPQFESVARLPASFVSDGPLVTCSWLLTDSGTASGMQYGADDLPEVTPSEPGCGADGSTLISGNRHLIQAVANPGNRPSTRSVELWAAVTHPGGTSRIDDVFWRIFYPDGNFKQQIVGDALGSDACDDLGVSAVGETAAAGSMFAAAVASGQMTTGYPSALLADCGSRRTGLFKGVTSVGYAEPCGEYRVEVHAGADDASTVAVHYFDVMCGQQINADFQSVSWGTLQPGKSRWLFGADRLDGAGVPQLSNFGSGGVEVGVRFSPMAPVAGSGEPIMEFGIAIRVAGTLTTVDRVAAGETVWLGDRGGICAGETAQLDAAVHPPSSMAEGAYQGSIDVLTRPFTGRSVCANDLGSLGAGGGSDQRSLAAPSGPQFTVAAAPPSATPTTTTTTSTTTSTVTTAPPESTTTTAAAGGSTTTDAPGESTTTTTTTTTSTTTTTTVGPPDPTQYPIPHVVVAPLGDGSLEVTVTIQAGVTIPGSDFDFGICLPLYDVDTNGDGVNDGDADGDGSFEVGEGWVYRCGFGTPPGDDLPFDPGLLGG